MKGVATPRSLFVNFLGGISMKFNIITINEMIDYINSFFNDSSRKVLYVGGMVGTDIFKYVLESATIRHNYEHIMFIEGCQDYIGLSASDNPNYMFYPDLLEDVIEDPFNQHEYNPFLCKWVNPKPEFCSKLNVEKFRNISLIIINNAHLIDPLFLKDITDHFRRKVVIITDPFDVGGIIYSGYPCITDSYAKLPVIQAMARHVYGFDSYSIDKHKSSLTEIKLQKRSIGKIDDKQYVSNDMELIEEIRKKQYKSGFRKNHKVIVTPPYKRRVFRGFASHNNNVFYNNTLMTIDVSQKKPWQVVRMYNSKNYIKCELTYDLTKNGYEIPVTPANIISLDQMIHHRFKHIVLVLNKDIPLQTDYYYSILKNTNNLQVVIK